MIGIIAALQGEADILLEKMQITKTYTLYGKTVYEGKAYEKDVALCLCGVGKVNAAFAAQILIGAYSPSALLNIGIAGGLNKSIQLGKVYQISSAVQFDFDLVQPNGTKIGTLNELEENFLPVQTLDLPIEKRVLATSDRFNDSKEDFKLLTEELNADIRDMEGAAIAQVAFYAKVPYYSFKSISDVAGNVSTTEQYYKNKTMAIGNLKTAFPAIFEKL